MINREDFDRGKDLGTVAAVEKPGSGKKERGNRTKEASYIPLEKTKNFR